MQDSLFEALMKELKDDEYRREYGAATAKYDLADALSEARIQKGLTQQELASLAGVSQAYIAKLESGEANPTIGHVGRILAAIGLRLKWSLGPLISADRTPEASIDLGAIAVDLAEVSEKTPNTYSAGQESGKAPRKSRARVSSQPSTPA